MQCTKACCTHEKRLLAARMPVRSVQGGEDGATAVTPQRQFCMGGTQVPRTGQQRTCAETLRP